MNTITIGHGGLRFVQPSVMVWQRVAEIAATVIGIVGFGVAVVALRFALSAQHFVTPHVALGISIGSALAAGLAFWSASRLEARRTALAR
jgi:hypothetical protein